MPLALLNQEVYGNWKTYGYSLFNEVYFPERNDAANASALRSNFVALRGVLLPSYPFQPLQVLVNLPG